MAEALREWGIVDRSGQRFAKPTILFDSGRSDTLQIRLHNVCAAIQNTFAGVVELADSGDLGSPATSVRVRVPSPAPYVGVAQMDSSATAF